VPDPVFGTGGTGYVGRPRESAERLGLVTRDAMVAALVRAVEVPPTDGVRIVDVPAIRRRR